MAFAITELHPVFAAEVSGIDVRPEVSPEAVEFLEDAMAKYAVVVLRDQHVGDDEQIEFSRHFGPRESPAVATSTFGNRTRLKHYLFDASNLDLEGNILAPDSPRRKMRLGDRFWHTDASFNPLPTKWSMLHGRIVPPEGGNTDFADTRAGYDALDDATKAKVDGLVARHVWWHSRERGGFDQVTLAQMQANPPVMHPIVRTVPRSERKALYLGAHAQSIVGMAEEAGAALLEDLVAHCTQDRFVYSHKWRNGDMVIWDNRCTLHRATPYDDLTYKRDMRRTTVDEFAPTWANLG